MTALHLVSPSEIEAVYPHIKDQLAELVVRFEGKLSADDCLAAVMGDLMQMWIVLDDDQKFMALALGEIVAFPRQRNYRLIGVTGRDHKRWVHHIAEIEEWARSKQCVRIAHVARKGFARFLPDYKLTHVLLERAL